MVNSSSSIPSGLGSGSEIVSSVTALVIVSSSFSGSSTGGMISSSVEGLVSSVVSALSDSATDPSFSETTDSIVFSALSEVASASSFSDVIDSSAFSAEAVVSSVLTLRFLSLVLCSAFFFSRRATLSLIYCSCRARYSSCNLESREKKKAFTERTNLLFSISSSITLRGNSSPT